MSDGSSTDRRLLHESGFEQSYVQCTLPCDLSPLTQRDLDKIINVDEFVRRIFQVIHSNDPVARGVTLRLLGEMARIMPERTSVHHAIRCALDSHDKVEMEAAIVAAASFAKESKTFASSIFGKLTSMIDGLATPTEMKLKLIRIFQVTDEGRLDSTIITKDKDLF